MHCFSLAAFKVYLSLVFRSVIMMCLAMDFFSFKIFRVYSASWISRRIWISLETFQILNLWIKFQSHTLLSLWVSDDMTVISFIIFLWVPGTHSFSLPLFFMSLCCSDCVNYIAFLTFMILFSITSILFLTSCSEIFI